MSHHPPLIALISATPAAITPAVGAFSVEYPEAVVWNILDDRLLQDANSAGGVTPLLKERMKRLIRHAVNERADGILLTCSIYGPVAHEIADQLAVPVYAADDAAFEATLASGAATVLVVAAGASQLADTESRLAEAAALAGVTTDFPARVAEGSLAAAVAGDTETLYASIVAAVESYAGTPDAILLAQYSLSPVADRLSAQFGVPVFAGPQRAAQKLRDAITAGAAL